MSPPRCRRCPPALLALLLGLAGSRGFPECRNGTVSLAVTAGGSLCLVPEQPPREWTEICWRVKMDSGAQHRILTATRDGDVSYPEGSQRRAEFQPGNLSLCLSPVHRADSGVYVAEFWNWAAFSSRCFRVSVWGIPWNLSSWRALAVAVAEGLLLLLVGGCCWWWERRKDSREG